MVLRKIQWDYWASVKEKPTEAEDNFPADPLADLKTRDNRLSVYLIERDNDPQLDRVLAALAAKYMKVDLINFALFDESVLKDLGLEYMQRPGDTFDHLVNRWHYDIVNLTARDLIAIAHALSDAVRDRREKKEVGRMIVGGLRAGHIDPTQLLPELLSKLVKEKFLQLSSVAAASY